MTPPSPWHPDDVALQAYAHGQGDATLAASVEAHLLRCPACRTAVRAGVASDRHRRGLTALQDRLDLVSRPRSERVLVRLGIKEADARALLAAPSLRWAWWLAVLACAALALLVARSNQDPDALFLLFAPLLPLLATSTTAAPALDPAWSLVAATPYRTMRMLLVRSLAVGCTALAGVALAALALPEDDLAAAFWLLPSVALTSAALALSARWGIGAVTATLGGSWAVLVALLERRGVDPVWVQDLVVQLGCGALAVASLIALARQWTQSDLRGNP